MAADWYGFVPQRFHHGAFALLYSGIQAVRRRPVGVSLMIGGALLVVGAGLGIFSALRIRAEENSRTAEVAPFPANDTPSSGVAA